MPPSPEPARGVTVLQRISPRLRRHLAAGAPALLLDALLFALLAGAGWETHMARAAAVFCGTAAAYLLHRRITYKEFQDAKTAGGQPLPFAALQIAAGVLNYGVFARLLYSLPHPVGPGGQIFCFALGALAGTCFNYLLLQRLLPASARNAPATMALNLPAAAEMSKMPAAAGGSAGRFKRSLLWLLMICITAQTAREHYQAVMPFPKLPYPLGPPDPDVWLYLTEARQWIGGLGIGGLIESFPGGDWAKAFFDHSVRNTNGPFGGITTPWTRPMEILLSAAWFLTPHELSNDVRWMLAATWLSPALGLAAIALLARALRAQFNSLHAAGFAGLLMVANPDTYNYFMPGNADHHGLLSTLWCGALALLMIDSLSAAGALALGVTLGVMVWISPEALMLTGAVYALLGAEALLRPARAASQSRVLALASLGAALAALAGLCIETPPAQIFRDPAYDTLSLVHVTLLSLTAAAACGLALAYRRVLSFGARFFAAAIASSGVVLGMAYCYPKFFMGPLVDVDSFIMTDFLPKVGEAKPLLTVAGEDIVRELMEPALALLLIAFALARRYVRPARLRRLLILLFLLLFTTGLTLCRVRWGYYMHPAAIAAIGMTLAGLGSLLRTPPGRIISRNIPHFLPRQTRPYIVLWLAYIVMNVTIHQLQVAAPPAPKEAAAPLETTNEATKEASAPDCLAQVRYVMQSGQLKSLLGTENIVLFVSPDAGGDALFFTPYRIIASNYHREGEGLRDLNDIGTAATAVAARPLLQKRKVAALLYCPADYAPDSWLRTLAEPHGRPAWLTPLGGLRIFYPPDGTIPAPGVKPLLFRVKSP